MANLLIGSSNLNRHYKVADFPSLRKYKMLKCTQFEGFEAYMGGLVPDNKNVLISVIENFIIDAVGGGFAKPEKAIDICIKDFLSTIRDAAIKFPKTKFGIVMPLKRPAVSWYNDRTEPIAVFLQEGIKAMISERSINNIAAINCISVASQQFEPDQIHLTEPSAAIFLEVILEAAERFFDAPLVDLSGGATNSTEDRLRRLESSVRRQQDKAISDNLMFARTREEQDAASNRAKENRIVINGLTSPQPLPLETRPRIEALKEIVANVFEKLIPGYQGKITYLSLGKQPQLAQQMIEVKMDSAENAIAIRKAFAERRKKKDLDAELDSLFMTNCVNLATRIRIDILKAIARKLTNSKDLAYVAGFNSRPMMHIRLAGPPSANTRPLKSYTFIDAVSRFGRQMTKEELETAYGRAGRSFNGQLQQNFVVLNENDQDALQSVSQAASGSGSGHGFGSGSGSGAPTSGGTFSGKTGARGGGMGGTHNRVKGVKRPGENFETSNPKK
jgi:hypothetical protein